MIALASPVTTMISWAPSSGACHFLEVWDPINDLSHDENYRKTLGKWRFTRPGKHTKNHGKIHHYLWVNQLFRLGHGFNSKL